MLWCALWCVVSHIGKIPCVDSQRPRVYRNHARKCYHMRAWCRYTRRPFECTHGRAFWTCTRGDGWEEEGEGRGVIASSAYRNLPTWGYHVPQRFTERNPWILHIFSLRIGREQLVPKSSNHSLLPDKVVQLQLSRGGGNQL